MEDKKRSRSQEEEGAGNKFMLAYMEITVFGKKKIREVVSLPLQLDGEKAISLLFLRPW